MFRWRRRRTAPTDAVPAASASASLASPTSHVEEAPAASPAPSVSVSTGELAAIAARLHGGPVRPAHEPAHKAVDAAAERASAPDPEPADDAPAPDLRPIAQIVEAALKHHFGPGGAWALVRRGPDSTAGFFDELMTAHIARDVSLALGASPAAAELPLVDARTTGADRTTDGCDDEARREQVARELAVFDEDPLDGTLAELAGERRSVTAALRGIRSA